jgi:hypothetical protein
MPRGTIPGGGLINISDCYIFIPNFGRIRLNNLPEISDSKSASYNDEPIIGRSFPLKTYSHSENRVIAMQLHFFVINRNDIALNLRYLRALESAVYPRDQQSGANAPFVPPPVCRLKCGNLLADKEEVCCVLKSYSVKFPTDVAWDEDDYLPHKFDVDTNWEVVYRSSDLPGQGRIIRTGR